MINVEVGSQDLQIYLGDDTHPDCDADIAGAVSYVYGRSGLPPPPLLASNESKQAVLNTISMKMRELVRCANVLRTTHGTNFPHR